MIAKFHRVKVSLPDIPARNGRIWIDDVELHGVRRIEMSAGFEDLTIVKIEFLTKEFELEALAVGMVHEREPKETS